MTATRTLTTTVAACAGLALLIGACAPTTPFTRPTPTPTPTSSSPTPGPTPTPAPSPTRSTPMPECNGRITTVDETAQFAPGKNPNEPTFVISKVGIENGAMYAAIVGGWPDGYPGWIKDRLYVGEPKHVPTIGTFTLLGLCASC
ncbi:hypothetical protein [Actinomyces sp.]|uniref:hypothetical protein n=1 Tax=Actinomyces sp. TaxID=29317 RepID=UPI0025C32ECC|nr:hypothetical protein [Actinomyces sp.]